MKFLSPEFPLYLYKSTICPCMEYCCHVWAGPPSCHMKLLDGLQNQICRAGGLSLAAILEPFARWQNVASLSLFYRCYFASTMVIILWKFLMLYYIFLSPQVKRSLIIREIRKAQNNVKTSWKYNLVPNLLPKKKMLSILAKDSLKIEIKLFS